MNLEGISEIMGIEGAEVEAILKKLTELPS
jgi:hypothetical protein